MAIYEIFLVKIGDPEVDEAKVTSRVEALFNQVTQHERETHFDSSHVNWTNSCSSVEPHELVVYVMQNNIDSVVTTFFENTFPSSSGATSWNGTVTGSEVYIQGCGRNEKMVANMIFHEAMHNKGHWNSRRLHGDFGGRGLASERIGRDTEPTSINIRRMADVLGNSQPQWTGGCAYFSDPLRGIGTLIIRNPDENFRRAVASNSGPVRGGYIVRGSLNGTPDKNSLG